MISLSNLSPRSASLVRALCLRQHKGRYWLHPAPYSKFLLLDAAGFEAVSYWHSGDRVKRYRIEGGAWMPLFDAVRLARSLSRETGIAVDAVTVSGNAAI